MIGNNNFNSYYNNFLLNNSNFISPSQNVGINNTFNKKPDNTTKANIDTASLSQDTEINENDNNNALSSLFGSLSNIANSDKSNINSKNQVPPKPEPLPSTNDILKYNFSEGNPYPSDVLEEMKFNIDAIKNSAKKTGIDEKLLYGILVAEGMRYKPSDYVDDIIHPFGLKFNTTKGLAQINLNAALEGEIYYRNHNKDQNDNIDTNDTKAIEKLKTEINGDIVSLLSNDKNIEYAAKYISYLQSEFPQSSDLKEKDQHKLIAAAYKAGPEAVRNARMQEQLNDFLPEVLDKKLEKKLGNSKKLTTDGFPGGITNEVIYKTLNKYKNQLSKNKKYASNINKFTPPLPKDPSNFYKDLYKNNDYPLIREMINSLWEKNHPYKENPPGAIPKNNDSWDGRVDLSVQDVLEAERYYVNHKY